MRKKKASQTRGPPEKPRIPITIRSEEVLSSFNEPYRSQGLSNKSKAVSLPSPQLSGDKSRYLLNRLPAQRFGAVVSSEANQQHGTFKKYPIPVAGHPQQFLHSCSDFYSKKPTSKHFHLKGTAFLDHSPANIQLNLVQPSRPIQSPRRTNMN